MWIARLGVIGFLASMPLPAAVSHHVWTVSSPDHRQTFSYGTEQNRAWLERGGAFKHLALALNFTNDPYVDRIEQRQYDNFIFDFPEVTLGTDGRTFYYRTSDGRSVPVAVKEPDFLGVNEIHLVPSAILIVKKPHGLLDLSLLISDHPQDNSTE